MSSLSDREPTRPAKVGASESCLCMFRVNFDPSDSAKAIVAYRLKGWDAHYTDCPLLAETGAR